jgi:NhaP-type Na+/H+ or K+/H+ antiporter
MYHGFGYGVEHQVRQWVGGMNFGTFLMKYMLGSLLFAGALHVNLGDLMRSRWAIAAFATLGVAAIPLVLLARLTSVGLPVSVSSLWRATPPRSIRIMTWGGLRGGISIALALSLPAATADQAAARDLILTMTYVVVAFSILVQGTTVHRLVQAGRRTA